MMYLKNSMKRWSWWLRSAPRVMETTCTWFFLLFSYCSILHVYSDAPLTFIEDARQSLLRSEYEYIIVGGGTAGCALAATLSLNFTVLVLERGGVPFGNPSIERLENFGQNLADISSTAPAQRFVSEDGVDNRRARVLGGGTCLNAGFYSRASREYVNRSGWDLSLVEDSYSWVERQLVFIPQLGEWQSAFRSGLLQAGVLPDRGVSLEHLTGTKTGASIFDGEGRRHTAADLLRSANATNIAVLIHATVERILFRRCPEAADDDSRCSPRAYGVLFSDAKGNDHLALVNGGGEHENEVILCAGALGSPQLLLLSGIGAADEVEEFGIGMVVNLQGVGKGMADNPTNLVLVPSPRPIQMSSIEIVGITDFGSFIEAGSMGILSSSGNIMASTVLPPISHVTTFQNVSTADEANTMQNSSEGMLSSTQDVGVILEKVIGPLSNGDLRLRTANISDNPIVRFNYFSQPQDLERCIQGMRVIKKVINSPAMADFTFRNTTQIPDNVTNEVLLVGDQLPDTSDADAVGNFCRSTVMTLWHYHGGCQLDVVVDRDYRVRGVSGLRVVDGSTFVFSPGSNPQATVMMLGRYMGMRILTERLQTAS